MPTTDELAQNLTTMITDIHDLSQHFAKFQHLSSTDVAHLREIIDHLQQLVTTLQARNTPSAKQIFDPQLVVYLQAGVTHLKNILLNEQASFQHSPQQQQQNELLSLQLIKQIKKLSAHPHIST